MQALSRAFGDAYLKSSAQFEGVPAGSDGYSSGFGLTCEPYITVEDVKGVLQCYAMLSELHRSCSARHNGMSQP